MAVLTLPLAAPLASLFIRTSWNSITKDVRSDSRGPNFSFLISPIALSAGSDDPPRYNKGARDHCDSVGRYSISWNERSGK